MSRTRVPWHARALRLRFGVRHIILAPLAPHDLPNRDRSA